MEERTCPLCKNTEKEVVFRKELEQVVGLIGKVQQEISICFQCGMVFTSKVLSDKDLNEYYSNQSSYEYEHSNYEFPVYQKNRSEQQFRYINSLLPNLQKVVDIGCSVGYLLKLFLDNGSEVVGFEPSEKLKETAWKLYGVEVRTEFFDEEVVIESDIDLVILSHVLEHLKHPQNIISSINKYQNESGYIFIEIPAIELFDERDPHQFFIEHINYFSLQTLTNLMRQSGYKLVHFDHFINGSEIAPFYPTLASLWRKIENTESVNFTLYDYYSSSVDKIKSYQRIIDYERTRELQMLKHLRDYDKIALYGAGSLLSDVLSRHKDLLDKVEIVYDSDSKKHGSYISKKCICEFNHKDILDGNVDINAIVITSWSSEKEISEYLNKFQLGIPIIPLFENSIVQNIQ